MLLATGSGLRNSAAMQKSEVSRVDRHVEVRTWAWAYLRDFTCEAHESSLSGLSPQPLYVFVVDVDQVDSLQPKRFGRHNHLLPRVKELAGIFGSRGT